MYRFYLRAKCDFFIKIKLITRVKLTNDNKLITNKLIQDLCNYIFYLHLIF